ncbi:MAG: di-heme oxidoredictase family protein [Myxococcota bacterium]
MFNERSCAACHSMGGPGGAGPNEKNTLLLDGALLHRQSTDPNYMTWRAEQMEPIDFIMVHVESGTGDLDFFEEPILRTESQRNTPALWGIGLIELIPEEAILAQRDRANEKHEAISGRASRSADGALNRLGWKGDVASVDAFVRQACSHELGLSVPGSPQPPLATHPKPPRPKQNASPGLDLDEAGVSDLIAYLNALPRPTMRYPLTNQGKAQSGQQLFSKIGCDGCHTPELGGVDGIYSDLLLHDMGAQMDATGGSYGFQEPATRPVAAGEGEAPAGSREWRTPPLWGVADSAPYLHDGRAPDLATAISMHGEEAQGVVQNWFALTTQERQQILNFLGTLKAPHSPHPQGRG